MSHDILKRSSFWTGLALVAALGCVRPLPHGAVVVARQPPADQVEVIVVSPGPGYFWSPGFWRWDRTAFVWVTGWWVIAPSGFHRWVPGYWKHHRRGWYWVEGRWRR
jgi:hypothetical protein